ncbi:Putative cell wall binding repeat-containing protein, partial [Methylobacterium sp. 190mf]
LAAEKPVSTESVQQQAETNQTGWKVIDGKRYYIQKDGSIAKPDETGFFVPEEGGGAMLNEDGSLNNFYNLANNRSDDGFKMDRDNGWQQLMSDQLDKKEKFYLKDGLFQTGFQDIDGKTYYFNEDGTLYMKEKLKEKNGKTYYFNDDHSLVKGTRILEIEPSAGFKHFVYLEDNAWNETSGFKEINGKKYYISHGYIIAAKHGEQQPWIAKGPDGDLAVNEDGSLYTGWGVLANRKYYFEDGKTHKWTLHLNGKQYYFDGDGIMHTGWLTWNSDQTKSYFKKDGSMAKNETMEIDGVTYNFDEKGSAR